ncbi:class I SAM-dependent methyltransferase [Saccharibacillus sp. JS10]|uniref:class I SAM-dependent methyltransferase n=1 Tax=Saccharibacillus sp. JS10 TaxID=2950552 RepID=UPI00210C6804|nr:class I SAM-dependent methyltransferase [Saccharibacillus sp. JS10]MCQ4088406.1 class I SAM-dependent methyltransferase [Saccharibacillus sp. JS10]
MSEENTVYATQSEQYEAMISRQPNLAHVINEIRPFNNLDVLDLGAGSGRLSTVLAPAAKSLICSDISSSMLDILEHKLTNENQTTNWKTVVCDHRKLPIPDSSIDLVVSGWSICYLANTYESDWKENLDLIMAELERVLKPNGSIIIFETMGTGYDTPNPPEFLTSYFSLLEEKYGFQSRWIRVDYTFDSVEAAVEHTEFFFGEEVVEKIRQHQWATVPECAGIWWKQI